MHKYWFIVLTNAKLIWDVKNRANRVNGTTSIVCSHFFCKSKTVLTYSLFK